MAVHVTRNFVELFPALLAPSTRFNMEIPRAFSSCEACSYRGSFPLVERAFGVRRSGKTHRKTIIALMVYRFRGVVEPDPCS